jgi:hypothetical protein
MREVKPYKTKAGLLKSLDNGGRFFNIFTKSGDDQITRAELAKAAGVFGSAPKAVLFFEMAQYALPDAVRTTAVRSLGPKARKDHKKHLPMQLLPSRVDEEGVAGRGVIVEGYPRFLKNKQQFTGMIMIPIMAGSVTTFTMIPIMDAFDVYELFNDRRMRRPHCVLATVRGSSFPSNRPIRLAGILRKLEAEKKTDRRHKFYLEACYYTPLDRA